ncbi:hypothetical protein [Corynebacterium halotolerans]|uniref:Uncharacterized protein n=1 Tax=Corynebacterium halotolerans YIM 70093 = DSM 44683 TaxID=1121362 RepID=M1MZ38_9CORY|nr:hypothetical protein [Corynebacterium halotolerans]AGF72959.1 hypothetical protein A605_09785 [Corynebacterium halotolerans YIM 70093 = DSM 44683]
MSPLEQDEYIRRLVEAEIAHSRATIELQNTPVPPDPMAKWSPFVVAGVFILPVIVMMLSVLVVFVL